MNKVIIAILSVFTLALVSCELGKKFNSHGFEGEYEMRTTTYWTNEFGEEEKNLRDQISPVTMFVENNHLYIRTNSFGMPNMGDYDEAEIEGRVDSPYEDPSTPSTGDNEGGENGNGEGIENVTVNTKAQIVMQNGFVIVIKGDKRLKSLPIEAFEVKEDKILFKNSETFDVALTNAEGTLMATMRNHFEYGQATLKNDTITWEVELFGDAGHNSSTTSEIRDIHVRYHNTLVRK